MAVQTAAIQVDVFMSVYVKEATGHQAVLTLDDQKYTLDRHKSTTIEHSTYFQVIAEYDGDRVYLDFLFTTPTHSGMWSNEKDLFACRWGDRHYVVGTFKAYPHDEDEENDE